MIQLNLSPKHCYVSTTNTYATPENRSLTPASKVPQFKTTNLFLPPLLLLRFTAAAKSLTDWARVATSTCHLTRPRPTAAGHAWPRHISFSIALITSWPAFCSTIEPQYKMLRRQSTPDVDMDPKEVNTIAFFFLTSLLLFSVKV